MEGLINGGAPFTSAQARDLGIARKHLARQVTAGQVRRLLDDVYVDARVPATLDVRCQAVALVLPEGAVVARRTAAWVHGVDLFGPRGEYQTRTVECVTPAPFARVRRRGVKGYVAHLDMDDTVLRRGIPVTSPVRTAVDLARWLRRPHALAALDAMAHAGLVLRPEMLELANRYRRYRGIAQARELIAIVEPRTESPGESWLRLRIIDAGFPRPEAQIVIEVQGRQVYRLDLGYPGLRIGLEYDGEEFHGSAEARRHDDARRDDLRRRFGWDVYGFGRGDVWGVQPHVEQLVGGLLGRDPMLPRTW
jgi:hypothetical protein